MSVELDETQPATRDSSRALPTRIGKYELGERLGAGGNGIVWLARDVTLDRKVAIKLLRGDASDDASQRLLREAQSAAKLAHENIVVVHEVGTHDGEVFVAMEYVPGGTLRDAGRTRSWRDVLDLYRRAGRGLAAAHAAGLVHRDFKPDNVLVSDDGRVRVTDFGLVSVGGTHAAAAPATVGTVASTSLTRTGAVMGTPRYMAPEQHEGDAVDARADQFSFCVALYEALFQRLPFDGETYDEIARHVCAGEIVAPPADSPVPREIREAILRGLAPAPADRWPSMTALLDALSPSPPPPPPRRRWWIAAIPAVLLVAAISIFFVERARRETVREAFARAQAAYEHGDYQTAAAGFRRAFELDPDLDGRAADYVYDMGASYELLGNCPDAVVAYRRYLTLGRISDADRARTEEHLRKLGDCKPAALANAAYAEGEAAYDRGDFSAAVAAFKRGFALQEHWDQHSASYLYNVGQAYRQMGQCADAAAAFRQFLSLRADLAADMRAHIEELVTKLDGCAAQQGSANR